MKSWQVDALVGWLMIAGVILGNIACIYYDPNGSDWPILTFWISQAISTSCGLRFFWMKRVNKVALLGQSYLASSWIFACVKIAIGYGYERSNTMLVAYVLMLGLITTYVTTKRTD